MHTYTPTAQIGRVYAHQCEGEYTVFLSECWWDKGEGIR